MSSTSKSYQGGSRVGVFAAFFLIGIFLLARGRHWPHSLQEFGDLVAAYRIRVVVLFAAFFIGRSIMQRKLASTQSVEVEQTESEPVPDLVDSVPEDLRGRLRRVDSTVFEYVVRSAFELEGYKIVIGAGGNDRRADWGIHLLTEAGSDKPVPYQCKHYLRDEVEVGLIKQLISVIKSEGSTKGIFVTMKGYTQDAVTLAKGAQIRLIDEHELVKILENRRAQWKPELTKLLTGQTPECTHCGGRMFLGRDKGGPYRGELFWSCDKNECRHTQPF